VQTNLTARQFLLQLPAAFREADAPDDSDQPTALREPNPSRGTWQSRQPTASGALG